MGFTQWHFHAAASKVFEGVEIDSCRPHVGPPSFTDVCGKSESPDTDTFGGFFFGAANCLQVVVRVVSKTTAFSLSQNHVAAMLETPESFDCNR